MKNPRNAAGVAFVFLVWTTLLVIWAYTALGNVARSGSDFKFKTVEEIINGSH